MPRYIDADKARDNSTDPYVKIYLDSQPTADVAPVVHAHWIFHKGVFANNGTKGCFECSGCKTTIDTETFDRMYECGQTRLCGACGAKMDEEIKL